jgi:DNA-binding LacI/PurR family transcriptional regulator
MRELDLPWRPELERTSAFGFASGASALCDLVESTSPLEAIVFANDALAVGALLEPAAQHSRAGGPGGRWI